uniref:US22 family protein n=1 Tax=Seriola lalandi dorsalis TaxID=1841481 RepID=A0A3B4WS33_SERLL
MAGVSVASQPFMPDFQQCSRAEGRDYLAQVSHFVSKNKHKTITLKNPADAILKVAGVEDTIYRGKHDEVNGWGKFYLPKMVNMLVIGVVEGTSCTCDQLVLMTCEDKKLYAYDGEELHLVASHLDQLCNKEIEYPASKSYYNGEAFEDTTEADWEKVRMGPVGRSLEQEHQKLVKKNKSAFLASLKGAGHK